MDNLSPRDTALQVAQQALSILCDWAADASRPLTLSEECTAVTTAKKLLKWPEIQGIESNQLINRLGLLFDQVHLPNGQKQEKTHYWPVKQIADKDPSIPYPRTESVTDVEISQLKQQIRDEIKLESEDWENLSLLMLILEKYGSYLSFGADDISLVDMARTTAAVAAALAKNTDANQLSLIAGDLSGIQKFIYTISSDGALKSLRARSFYLELVTEEVVQQVLKALDLPRTNVIYAGGGNLYVLADGEAGKINKEITKIRNCFNEWLLRSYQGKLFLCLDYLQFPLNSLEAIQDSDNSDNIAYYWSKITTANLAQQKARKFNERINDLLKPKRTYEPCRVCHRDDLPSLKPLNPQELDSSLACWTCRRMFDLGDELFKINAIVRSEKATIKGAVARYYLPGLPGTYYYLFPNVEEALKVNHAETVYLINNWKISNYRASKNSVLLLLGNYGKETEKEDESGFMRAGEFAEKAQGINRLGYLRMDVDRLGQIFAKGLGNNQTLPRLAGLSRQMTYFFKVYLNNLAKDRQLNLPPDVKQLTSDPREEILFIYAGGDDLFVSGSWNQAVEFAFDVYQSFRAYTGHNPDITLSGGMSIEAPKFPLYQAAKEAGEAEEAAKGNGRDSLGLFGSAFKWEEWLGKENINVANIKGIDRDTKKYLGTDVTLDLFGIFVFAKVLNSESLKLETNYARSFVRNLLATADIQDRMIEEIKAEIQPQIYAEQEKDIRYYLHLPKIAYTLARLPENVREHPNFAPVRKSLLSPYNAPYFRAIATWIELLNRANNHE